MGSQVPPRRIVPPAPPVHPQTAAEYHYAPVKIPKHERSNLQTALLGSGIVVVLVLGAVGLRIWMTPSELAIQQAITDRANQLAAEHEQATQVSQDDEMRAGWVGMLELPLTRATVSISSMHDDSKAASDLARDFELPASLASITIDNSAGADDLSIDTTPATLQFADGSMRPAIKPMDLLMTAKKDRNNAMLEFKPPYRCPRGERLGKPLFLPRGIDTHALIGVTILVNGEKRQVTGSFMDETKKAAMLRDRKLVVGDTNKAASEPVALPAAAR